MSLKYQVKLGELIHISNYSYTFTRDQTFLGRPVIDENNHVNNAGYMGCAEVIRQERFLPYYGFSDEWFNQHNLQQIMGIGVVDWRGAKGIEAGEKANVEMRLYVDPGLYFHMTWVFSKENGELGVRMLSENYFNKKSKGVWIPSKKIPEFFIDAIRK